MAPHRVLGPAACGDPSSPVVSAATGPAALKRDEAPTQAATARLLVTGLEDSKEVQSAPTVRCTSPRHSPARSGASIRRPAP